MKIAFVNDTFLEGRGVDTVIYELVKELGQKHEVYVIASKVKGFKEKNFKIIKINSEKLYTGTIRDLLFFYKIKKFRDEILKLQEKHKFDIFNVHHSALNIAFKNLPTIVTWHGSPPTKNLVRKWINKLILRTLKRNKKTVVVSNYLKKRLMKFKIKIIVIPNGVSEEFRPTWKDKNYMLYVGRHEPYKRIDEVIELSKELNFLLIIVGSGPLTEKLKKYVKKIKAPVKFVGHVSRKKLIKLYQECSFFVSASRWEGFGLIFLEAAACGKPSIAYNICTIPEVVKHDKTGFLINNYGELKFYAEKLIKNKGLRKEMGKKALRFIKNFSWKKVAKMYRNHLRC